MLGSSRCGTETLSSLQWKEACILSISSADRGAVERPHALGGQAPSCIRDLLSRLLPRAAARRDVAEAATRVRPFQLHAAIAARPAPPVSLPPSPPRPPHPHRRRRPRRRHRRRYRLRHRPRASRVGPAGSTAIAQRETPPARARRPRRCTACAHPPPTSPLRRSGVLLARPAALVQVLNGLRCRTRARSCTRCARDTAPEARAAGRLREPHRSRSLTLFPRSAPFFLPLLPPPLPCLASVPPAGPRRHGRLSQRPVH